MEFGAELDDDLFETSRNKECKTSFEYCPKVYDTEWFVQCSCSETEEEHLTHLKSHADYLYYSHKYSDCIKKYMECLEILQSSNITLRRDCLEGISRSYMHQEQLSQALFYALKLFGIACNINHKVVAWSLLASVYHRMGRFSDELDTLHQCLQHHSWNYDFWLRLAFCYSGLFGVELNREIQHKLLHSSDNYSRRNQPVSKGSTVLDEGTEEVASECESNGELNTELCSTRGKNILAQPCEPCFVEHNSGEYQRNVNVTSSNHDDSESSCWQDSTHPVEEMPPIQRGTIIICACLVRARLLLQTCILGYHSFAHDSNIWQQEQVILLINSLDVEESIVGHCMQVYLRDIGNEAVDCIEDKSVLEKLKEKCVAEEEESGGNIAQKQFEAKWFGWLFTK